ncbi:hypothetical protein V9T40_012499 [Parthenolecanium corni]|uniref:L-xylulose reductase n=1 Tax=Parthenolecanium corni TaxID=536013 RepID=A0AAN9Y0L3_9HEMI
MNITFENKRVLVTGAGKGIGYDIAKAFVKCGAEKVFALSKTKANLDKLAAESPLIVPVCVDLGDWNAARKAVESLGPIDVLINNAAVAECDSFFDVKPESIDRVFNINVKSVINVSQVVAAGMVQRKTGGAIVNISSQAAQAALADHVVYGATKAAVDSITRCMALELGEHNIRVNSVNPTVVWTEMGAKHWSDEKRSKPMLEKIPLHKFAAIEDVVHAVLFLASNKAAMVNAVTLPVDGGFLAC